MDDSGEPGRGRLLLALAVLPLVDAALVYLGWPLIWWLSGHGEMQAGDRGAAASFAGLVAIISALVIISEALPAVWWLRRHGRFALRPLLLAGLLLGNTPFVAFVAFLVPFAIIHVFEGTISQHLLSFPQLVAGTLRAVAIGSALGVLSAAVFWLIAGGGPFASRANGPHAPSSSLPRTS